MRALVLVALFFSLPAWAHGEWAWIQQYNTPNGMSCCDRRDATPIAHEVANEARVGSEVVAPFPNGPIIVKVLIIHPTRDPKGRAWITKYGCLFRHQGM
jgi:hypothetical protein